MIVISNRKDFVLKISTNVRTTLVMALLWLSLSQTVSSLFPDRFNDLGHGCTSSLRDQKLWDGAAGIGTKLVDSLCFSRAKWFQYPFTVIFS